MTTLVTITHAQGTDHNVLIETVDDVRPPLAHHILAPGEALEVPVYKGQRLIITEYDEDSTSGKPAAARVAAQESAKEVQIIGPDDVGDVAAVINPHTPDAPAA